MPAAAGNCVNAVQVGTLMFLSRNILRKPPYGKLGKDLTAEQGYGEILSWFSEPIFNRQVTLY